MRFTLLLLAACAGSNPGPTDVPSDPPDTDGPIDTAPPTDTDPGDTDAPPDTGEPVDTDVLPGCVTTQSTDFGADGVLDFVQSTRFGPGFRVVELDADGDGLLDQRETSAFAVNGVQLSREVVQLPNNQLLRTEITTVDAQERPIRSEIDADADGTPDQVTTWAYHPAGGLDALVVSLDANDDGTPDHITVSTYDLAGAAIAVTEDLGGDGTIDASQSWTWGDPRVHRFFGEAGALIRAVRTTLDAQGRTRETAFDDDGDGTYTSAADQVWRTAYTPAGGIEVHEVDGPGPDGLWDVRVVTTYDGNGRQIQRTTFAPPDVVTQRETTVYDGSGRVVSMEFDLDGDGVILNGWERIYEPTGQVREETGLLGGLPSYVYTYDYDGNGVLALAIYDWDGNGVPDASNRTTRDSFGREIRIDQDETGDLLPEVVRTFTYSCPP